MDAPETRATAYRSFAERGAELAAALPVDDVTRRVEKAYVRLCRHVSPTISLELGAHEARFSRRMKRFHPEARCLAFEANPYVAEQYAERATSRGVEYVVAALAATNGTVELTIPTVVGQRPRGRANKMASLGQHRFARETETVTVPSMRLDDVVQLAPDDRVVAWIDVEGASEIVLGSSRETLARASLVYIEVESKPIWAGQWLDTEVAAFFDDIGLVPIMRDVQRPRQYNVVFASPQVAADPVVVAEIAGAFAPDA